MCCVKPPGELALKGYAVEEWTDVHFFRPLGAALARALQPTRVSADQITLGCLLLGLAGGHLFVYRNVALNLIGVGLFVASDVLDSADGQLARLRGTSSRFGRILDGLADSSRFLNLYLHLAVRMVLARGWPGGLLVFAALTSHSLQAQVVDFVRNAYLRLAERGRGELDLPEELAPLNGGRGRRLAARLYRIYVQRQEWLFPHALALVRAVPEPLTPDLAEAYAERQRPVVSMLALIGQNIRFPLLALGALVGMRWYLWITLLPLNLVAATILAQHERNAASTAAEVAAAQRVKVRV
jgi:phosphatidylglycerophosphate synthase